MPDVFIKVDAGSVIWMNGSAVESKTVISALLNVYKAGKFPFLMIEKHPALSDEKLAPISISLMRYAPIGFRAWRD